MSTPATLDLDTLASAVDLDLGHTPWLPIDQDRVDEFARATNDQQWIHTDPVRAAGSRFCGAVAHGFLTLSLSSWFLDHLVRVPKERTLVNYGLDRVRFPAPVMVGSAVLAAGSLASASPVGDDGFQLVVDLTVEAERQDRPVCVARFLVRVE